MVLFVTSVLLHVIFLPFFAGVLFVTRDEEGGCVESVFVCTPGLSCWYRVTGGGGRVKVPRLRGV